MVLLEELTTPREQRKIRKLSITTKVTRTQVGMSIKAARALEEKELLPLRDSWRNFKEQVVSSDPRLETQIAVCLECQKIRNEYGNLLISGDFCFLFKFSFLFYFHCPIYAMIFLPYETADFLLQVRNIAEVNENSFFVKIKSSGLEVLYFSKN